MENASHQAVTFTPLTVASGPRSRSFNAWLHDGNVLEGLRQQLRVGYHGEAAKIVESANARLTRSLGSGFRSEAQLTSADIGNVSLAASGLQINLRAGGHLKILYGL